MRREELTYAGRAARRGGRPRTGQDTRSDQGHAAYRKSLVPHDTPLRLVLDHGSLRLVPSSPLEQPSDAGEDDECNDAADTC